MAQFELQFFGPPELQRSTQDEVLGLLQKRDFLRQVSSKAKLRGRILPSEVSFRPEKDLALVRFPDLGEAASERFAQVLVESLSTRLGFSQAGRLEEELQQAEDELRALSGLDLAPTRVAPQDRLPREVHQDARRQRLSKWKELLVAERRMRPSVRRRGISLVRTVVAADKGPYVGIYLFLLTFLIALEMLRREPVLSLEGSSGPTQLELPEALVTRLQAPVQVELPPIEIPEIKIPEWPPFPELPAPNVETSVPRVTTWAEVPLVRGVDRGSPRSYLDAPDPRGRDAFSFVLARLDLIKPRPKVIQVSALLSGSSSTYMASQLAASASRAGRRVALVDANLRHPFLDRVFGEFREEGLTDLLLDTELDEWMAPYPSSEITLVPAGPVPPQPEEVLASPRLEGLLDALASSHDLVILDSASFGEGPDAYLISAVVDGVLLAHPGGLTPREGQEVEELQGAGVPILGRLELGFPSEA